MKRWIRLSPDVIAVHPGETPWNPPSAWCGTQRIEEFARYVDILISEGVESMVRIGAASGGNEWYIAHRYAAAGMPCRILSIDIKMTGELAYTLSRVREMFEPKGIVCELILANSAELKTGDLGGPFDHGFIDGVHSVHMALNDYNLIDPIVTGSIGFHDINNIGYENNYIGSHEAWERVKLGKDIEEISFGNQYGIGMIYKRRRDDSAA